MLCRLSRFPNAFMCLQFFKSSMGFPLLCVQHRRFFFAISIACQDVQALQFAINGCKCCNSQFS